MSTRAAAAYDDDGKDAAGLADTADRLSWHSLQHSFASILATDLEFPATTLARLIRHSDARLHAQGARSQRAAVIEDVLARAVEVRVGG